MFFESHAHYDDEDFNLDREALLKELPETVSYVINVGANMESTKKGLTIAEKYPYIYQAIGVHPHDANKVKQEDISTLEEYSKSEKVVAIGEIGLDYHYDFSPRETQIHWFCEQLELSKRVNLPVIIHSREASQNTYDILKESGVASGVVHCFPEGRELAKCYLNMNFYIGVGGIVTFKNAKKLIEVVEYVPMDRILIETDCPYLSPEPKRGTRNDSRNLIFIAQKIADIKKIPLNEVVKKSEENAFNLFTKIKKLR